MDLKIQHSCRLTTSQLKGSGFGSLQSDPHCALHYSTAAVIPTRRGSAEAVMTLHFFEMPVIMPLAGKKYGQSTCCKGGQGGYVRVICKRHNWTQVISELSNKELCSIGALLGFRKGLSAFIQIPLDFYSIHHFEATFPYCHNSHRKEVEMREF